MGASHVAIVPAERTAAIGSLYLRRNNDLFISHGVLGLRADDFRAKKAAARSDDEVLELCMADHASLCVALSTRKTHVAAVRALWTKGACAFIAVFFLADV